MNMYTDFLKKVPLGSDVSAFLGGGKVTVTNNTAAIQLSNPANSKKAIVIDKFFVASDSNVDVQFVRGGTVNTPTSIPSSNLIVGDSVTANGMVLTGITNVTGGTSFGPIARMAANITSPYDVKLILKPGQAIAVTFLASALTTLACYASAVWYEADV